MCEKNDWEELWTFAESKIGYISLLVNNAGIGNLNPWQKCVDVMLYGAGHGITEAMKSMSKSEVNIYSN